MIKIRVTCFFYLLLLHAIPATAQGSAAAKALKEEQGSFLLYLKGISNDSAITYPLARQFESETNIIYTSISKNKSITGAEKEKALRSLLFFIKGLMDNIAKWKADLYDIPGALNSYRLILDALLYHRSLRSLVEAMPARRSQLLANTFSQYKEYSLLDDAAVYKRVSSQPQFIMYFLESKPGFRYSDSLLIDAVSYDPLKFILYFNKAKPDMQEKIRQTKNIYLQQVITLSGEKNVSALLPFVMQLAENKITAAEILQKRKNVTEYFQLLVDALKESNKTDEYSPAFLNLLRKGIKESALSFYTNPVNEMHSAADATRFTPVKGLRAEDIYYIITSCGDELYTSSYLGLYKRLMENFKNQHADSLFRITHYDQFSNFIRLAANYNVLSDFLRNMSQEAASGILKRFIAGIEKDIDTGLEKAMNIADSFNGLDSALEIKKQVHDELQQNLRRCRSERQYYGIRLYGILLQVFELAQQPGQMNKLWSKLGNYEVLKRQSLENKKGEIVQLVLFYGDEDGVASFSSFLKLYTDTSKWIISKNTNWVNIRSRSGEPVTIYANQPLDSKTEMDLRAQDSLTLYLEQQSLEPAVLIHRGHSYHLENSLKRLKPSVKLAILGSCGGYNNAISIASINPDVQIIASKKTGAKSINDPIIDVINEMLINKKDLAWKEIWSVLINRFSKDEFTLGLFNEYIPPSRNVSLFVLKLFNFYNRYV